MKKTFLIQFFVIAILALGLVACDTRQDRDVTTDDRGTDTYTPGTGTDMETRTETQRDYYFFDDSRDYTYAERNEFRQDIQESRNQLDQEITRLESELDNVSADQREEHREKINELKDKRDKLDAEIKGFDRTTEDNWDEFKDNVTSAWNDVEDSYEEVTDDMGIGRSGDIIDRDNRNN
jgi:peptidoglycan hydrolase CwlO-like protein